MRACGFALLLIAGALGACEMNVAEATASMPTRPEPPPTVADRRLTPALDSASARPRRTRIQDVSATPSRFPPPPADLHASVVSTGIDDRKEDETSTEQIMMIEFQNETSAAYDAVEVETVVTSGGKTHRERTVLEGGFPDILALHTGSLLPGQVSRARPVRSRLPLELYTYGRTTEVRIVGARPATKPLSLKDPDSVWIFMRTAPVARIVAALAENPDLVDFRTKAGVSPLLMACSRRDFAPLEAVLSAGGSLGDRTKRGLGPLHMAAMSGEGAMVSRLVRARQNPSEPSLYSQTPLHVAVYHRNVEAARALIEAGVDLEIRDTGNSTALILTPSAAAIEMAELLLAKGANPRAATRGVTYMNAAASFGQIPFLELGARYGLKLDEAEPKTGLTPLHWAAQYNRIEAVDWLLAQGATPDARNRDGLTPLELHHKHDDHPVNRRVMEEVFARRTIGAEKKGPRR